MTRPAVNIRRFAKNRGSSRVGSEEVFETHGSGQMAWKIIRVGSDPTHEK